MHSSSTPSQHSISKIQSKKSLVKKVFLIFVGLIFLPLAIAGTVLWLDRHAFFAIKNIEIEVNNQSSLDTRYLSPKIKEVQSMMDSLKGESLLRTNLPGISQKLERLDWVISYQITRRIPNTLKMNLAAHIPQVLIQTKGGKLYPVSEDGAILTSVEPQNAPDLIIAVGENFYNKPELRKKTIELLNKIPRNGSFSRQNISEIKHDQKDGFWMTMVRSNLQVKMGEEDLDIKATRISQVIDYLEQHQIKARVIDANLSKKVLVRLHKGP